MLLSLQIKDFGIIDQTGIDFAPGLNVLTGETGSGKSIIIEAIQVVTGGRALSEYVRAGCDRAVVQAAVEVRDMPEVLRLLSENGVAAEPGETVILTREINRNGRNLCRINGGMVSLGLYREVGRRLVDIQGQNEQQLLFDPERQLYLLDQYGGEEVIAAGAEVTGIYRRLREVKEAVEEMRRRRREWAGRQELINYQIRDIDGASLRPGEEEDLAAERRRLVNAEKLSRLVGEVYRDLYGGESHASSLELTGRALKALERVVELDPGLAGVRDAVAGALYQIEEACGDLSRYADGLEYYPARLEFVEERLDLLSKLKKKYGGSVEEILRYREEIAAELEEMEGGEEKIELMEEEMSALSKRLEEQADRLTALRRRAAGALEKEIARELADLDMAGSVFSIIFSERESIGEQGRERAEFFISTNPGEPVRPLSKVASGGETSRLMLAVKSILAEMEGIPTLVFDEIDTGIGGRTIRAVAVKLRQLGEKRQVVCVTHSPSVASVAQNHLVIRKGETGGRTRAGVYSLDEGERLKELARMLGGGEGDRAALNHARQLLEEAKKPPV
ncbi:MAG: DNA repair protein RecN [Peptococcaceae bacterium]|nr:DNA repair protein RecN [Peptococcaceae bacterium]